MINVERIDARLAGVKIPPQSVEAEQAVLGACLMSPRAADEARAVISAEDFLRMDHRAIFRAICEIQDAGGSPDPVTVSDRCDMPGLDMAYLFELVESAPGVSNAAGYAEVIREKSERRQIIEASHRIADIGFDRDPEWVARAHSEADAIGAQRGNGTIQSAAQAAKAWVQLMDERVSGDRGLQVGFRDLDWRWGGLRPGNLFVVAGRPGSGKTTLAMNIAENISATDDVLVFSLEMAADELIDRTQSRFSGVPLSKLRAGDLSRDDWPKIAGGAQRIKQSHLWLDDTPGLHVSEMRARARAQHRKTPLSVVIIDYLQLMRGDGENQNLRVGDITGQCKALAKELRIPVILLSQLSRECEKRADKRPILSDLRDSGSVEQDADYVAFVYRDDLYNANSPAKGTMEVITSKMRMGRTGTNYLRARLEVSTLEDVSPEYQPPARSSAKRSRAEDNGL